MTGRLAQGAEFRFSPKPGNRVTELLPDIPLPSREIATGKGIKYYVPETMQVVLVEPEIPPNTGNIARLCAATNTPLHLVEPLGFQLTDRQVRRAGLDYWHAVTVVRHPSLRSVLEGCTRSTLFFFSKHGVEPHWNASFRADARLIFGSETRGLPDWVFEEYPDRMWTIPMQNAAVRSLNLSNAVAVVLYEALRQLHTARL